MNCGVNYALSSANEGLDYMFEEHKHIWESKDNHEQSQLQTVPLGVSSFDSTSYTTILEGVSVLTWAIVNEVEMLPSRTQDPKQNFTFTRP